MDERIEQVASKPPKWLTEEYHGLWRRLVIEGRHATYGGAVAHFKAKVSQAAEGDRLPSCFVRAR